MGICNFRNFAHKWGYLPTKIYIFFLESGGMGGCGLTLLRVLQPKMISVQLELLW